MSASRTTDIRIRRMTPSPQPFSALSEQVADPEHKILIGPRLAERARPAVLRGERSAGRVDRIGVTHDLVLDSKVPVGADPEFLADRDAGGRAQRGRLD